jgi:hypothetical protein
MSSRGSLLKNQEGIIRTKTHSHGDCSFDRKRRFYVATFRAPELLQTRERLFQIIGFKLIRD